MSIYSGTYGFVLTIKTGANLTDTTNMRLRIKRPSSTIDKLLTNFDILEPKTSGVVTYTTVNGDFSESGKYSLQLFDETTGRRLASNVITVTVKPSLEL